MTNTTGWYGVDFDGTLVKAPVPGTPFDPGFIGDPVPLMVSTVRYWLSRGRVFKVFTARVWSDGTPETEKNALIARSLLTAWTLEHLGQMLAVTNIKDPFCIEIWDDRAIQIEKDKGVPYGWGVA